MSTRTLSQASLIHRVSLCLRFGDTIEFRRNLPNFSIWVNQHTHPRQALLDAHRSHEEFMIMGFRVTDAWENPTP